MKLSNFVKEFNKNIMCELLTRLFHTTSSDIIFFLVMIHR